MMFKAFRSLIKFRFCRYGQSLQKYKSLEQISKTQLYLNKKATLFGIPILSQQVANNLLQITSNTRSPTIIFMSDCSPNLYINSQIADTIFKQKFYNNIVEGKELTAKINNNLEIPNNVQQCYIIPDTFMDGIWKQKDNQDEELKLDSETYTKIKTKLNVDYGFDPFYSLPVTEAFFNNPESICIAGMSQIRMRRCLADSYPLQLIKQSFLNAAQLIRQLKSMKQEQFNQISAYKAIMFQFKQLFPDVMIGKQAEQLFYLMHQLEQQCTVFAQSTIVDRLQQLVLLSQSSPEILSQIKTSKGLHKILSYPTSPDQDQVQLQKHAILQCIFQTQLWDKPYVYNKYPYLKVNYNNLLPQQKQSIQERYQYHYNRYLSAWNKLTE